MLKGAVRAKLKSLTAVAILCVVALSASAQNSNTWSMNVSPLPAPTGPVNDYAGVIDEATKTQLNQKLIDYQRKTGIELAVAVVRTTGERGIFDYSLAVYRGWGIGSKGDDNPGALLFIAVDDRKYFTQVGSNLEDELPDGLVGSIQKQYLVPEIRNGNFGKGISGTIDAYIRAIDERNSGTAASPTPVRRGERGSESQGLYSGFCCLVLIGVVILIILSNRGGKSGGRHDGWGGGFGGGGGALPWIIGSAIGNMASSSSDSSSSGWGGSSDWGGGGSDWGGFGGGGDASGGGAGGDW